MDYELPFHITIARQLGSGGSYLAQRLAHRLGFVYLDHQILEQAARELDISDSEMIRREERTQSFWAKLLEAFATGCPEDIQSPPSLRLVSDDELIAAEHKVLLKLASRGSCVIVGRCAFHRLKGRARLINIFVHAARDYRIRRVMQVYHAADPKAAEQMIERTDNDRRRYVQRISGASWYDARNYHLTIDISRVGFEAAEEMIVAIAERLMKQNGDISPLRTGDQEGKS
ncbi:MAG: cytidylate kinase-like family protein [Desulfobacterales bacterium]